VPGLPRIVVLVPARNEAPLIQRKLRNLAWVDWPSVGEHAHVCVVIDDGSTDETAQFALAMGESFGAEAVLRVLGTHQRAGMESGGKAAAIRRALSVLEGEGEVFDLVVLSDADVVLDRDALIRLVGAFEGQPNLGVVCGAQVFVQRLGDGPEPGLDGGPKPSAELYDRATAVVRAIESRAGRLFSIHGQLCAWRAGQGLEPPPGLAADDLEIGFRARAQGLFVRLVREARFYEEKARGEVGEAQAKRRAMAYFQVMRGRRWPLGSGFADRLQWLVYRGVPPVAPYALLTAFLLSLALAATHRGLGGALLLTLIWTLFASVRPGRTLVRRLWIIAIAQRTPLELSDRWDTLRSRTGVSEGT